MEVLVPGGVGHGGTFNGNGIAMAAAIWCVDEMRRRGPALFEGLAETGERLKAGLEEAARAAGLRVVTRGPGCVFWLAFSEDDPTDAEPPPYRRFRLLMRERGVRMGVGGRWYVSAAHGEAEIAETVAAARSAFRAMAA